MAQHTVWLVYFGPKTQTHFNPEAHFAASALERMRLSGFDPNHYSNWPVNEPTLESVKQNVDEVLVVSRWLNMAAVSCRDAEAVRNLPGIDSVVAYQSIQYEVVSTGEMAGGNWSRDLLQKQIAHLNGQAFQSKNFRGKGVRIAILDAGFPAVDKRPEFAHLHANHRILATRDFVKQQDFVYAHGSHGTQVLSCIAGMIDSFAMGLAPEAEFLLARTEMTSREPRAEELYWLAAAEWADKNGAHIINSSLAYTQKRYFPHEMDGQTSIVAKAARMAARRGILVVNAAGNDGDKSWKMIATPADVDSVLTVGGIDPYTDYHIYFSSFGPTADRKIKPDVAAFGHVVVSGTSGPEEAYGTSFSTPLVTGFAACLKQMHPQWTGMDIHHRIIQSASLHPYYDYAHGFGIPNAGFFFGDTAAETLPGQIRVNESANQLVVSVDSLLLNPLSSDTLSLEEIITQIQPGYPDYLFYHLEDRRGFLAKYGVVKVESTDVLTIPKSDFPEVSQIRVHYRGQTITHQINSK